MTWIDTVLVVGIVGFLILIVWSKVMGQSMLDTVIEIKSIAVTVFTGGKVDG